MSREWAAGARKRAGHPTSRVLNEVRPDSVRSFSMNQRRNLKFR
jgi:hypothetical protein